jgi:hypothetical protein
MTIEEAREHQGERVVCRLWDGSLVEGVIGCVVGDDVFVRRADGPGVLGSPEHVAQADLPAVKGVLF